MRELGALLGVICNTGTFLPGVLYEVVRTARGAEGSRVGRRNVGMRVSLQEIEDF
jgi:hypothetical protein